VYIGALSGGARNDRLAADPHHDHVSEPSGKVGIGLLPQDAQRVLDVARVKGEPPLSKRVQLSQGQFSIVNRSALGRQPELRSSLLNVHVQGTANQLQVVAELANQLADTVIVLEAEGGL